VPREPRTVGVWWQALERRFARLCFGHGTHNARDEAAWLVCHVLKIPFDALPEALDRPVGINAARRLDAIASRRVGTREPLAYLLHEAWLGDHRFYVDRRVIVPRSHIAELLCESPRPWVAQPKSIRRVLDLGTGSGCLAILAALAFPSARVDASDVSTDALAVARRNVHEYGLRERVRLVQSDLFAKLAGERYQLIVCNPPYVPAAAMRALPAEYRHEPRAALAGGKDGLDLIRVLLTEVPSHLGKDGMLVVEVGDRRAALERAFPTQPFTWLATSAGEDFVFLLRRSEMAVLANSVRSKA